MRRKIVLSLLVIGAGLFAVSLATLDGGLQEKARAVAEAEMAQFMGRPMRIAQVAVHLFPPSILLTGVTPADVRPQSDLRAQSILIRWNPLSLFSERILISHIVIERPTLVLTPQALREKPFIKDVQRVGRVLIRRIDVQRGILDYQDVTRASVPSPPENPASRIQSLTFKQFSAILRPDLAMRRFSVSLDGRDGAIATPTLRRPIDRLLATLTTREGEVVIRRAQITSGQAEASVAGTIPLDAPLDLRVTFALPLDAAPRWNGPPWPGQAWSGTLAGVGRLTGLPSAPRISGNLTLTEAQIGGQFLGTLKGDLTYMDGRLVLSSLAGDFLSARVSGEAEVTLADPLRYRGAVDYAHLPGDRAKAFLPQDIASQLDLAGVLADGHVTLSGSGKDWTPLVAEGTVSAKRTSATSHIPLPAAAHVARTIALLSAGEATWSWSPGRFEITDGTARLPGSRARARARWEKGDGLLWMDVESDEVAPLAAAWGLPATGRMRMQSTLGPTHRFEADLHLSDWTLRGQALGALTTRIVYHDHTLAFEQGMLTAHAAPAGAPPHYRFHGQIAFLPMDAPAFDFHTDIAEADPKEVFDFFSLKIPLVTTASGHLKIAGTPRAFTVSGPLAMARGGTLYGEPFDRGRLDLTVTEAKTRLQNVTLEYGASEPAQSPARLKGSGEIRYDGTYTLSARMDHAQRSHFLHARLPRLAGDIRATARGEGAFRSPHLVLSAQGQRLLYGPVRIGAGKATLQVKGDALRLEGAFPEKQIQFTGQAQRAGLLPFSFSGRFATLRLDPFFSEYLPAPLSTLTVLATGELTATGDLRRLRAVNLDATLSSLSGKMKDYVLKNDGPVILHAGNGVYTLDHVRLTGENTALTAQGSIVPLAFWNLFIQGEADLNLLTALTPKIASGRGTATLDLRIVDEWARPKIQGALSLSQGIIRTALLPQPIYIAALSAIFNKQVLRLETLDGRLGGGTFRAEGQADLVGLRPSRLAFQVGLSDVSVPLLAGLPATLSGDILLAGTLEKPALTGDLIVKNVIYSQRLDLKAFLLEFERRQTAVAEPFPFGETDVNVLLTGKDNLWIQNNLAKAPLTVDLTIKGTLARPLPMGRVEIPGGHIYFQDNDFQVVSGMIEFLDLDKIDPVFDIRARTRVLRFSASDGAEGVPAAGGVETPRAPVRSDTESYSVDLSLAGRLSQFTVEMISTPPLPEKDVRALLAGEATSLVISEFLAEPIQKLTGVDRVRVTPESTKTSNTTRIVAEKRLLDDRLSVVYSTTLDASEAPQIRMIYEVSPHISLVGEQDERGRKGGDLRFQFYLR